VRGCAKRGLTNEVAEPDSQSAALLSSTLIATLLGPEYSLSLNSLDSGLRLFLSRNVKAGEDMVEKQNAQQGLMPVVGNEAAEYGYEAQNRYFVQCFLEVSSQKRIFTMVSR
jgi:hypothetical protein